MTYHSGAQGLESLGIVSRDPHITCDGCGARHEVYRQAAVAVPFAWFMDSKAPPKWRKVWSVPAKHYCPKCSEALAQTEKQKLEEAKP